LIGFVLLESLLIALVFLLPLSFSGFFASSPVKRKICVDLTKLLFIGTNQGGRITVANVFVFCPESQFPQHSFSTPSQSLPIFSSLTGRRDYQAIHRKEDCLVNQPETS